MGVGIGHVGIRLVVRASRPGDIRLKAGVSGPGSVKPGVGFLMASFLQQMRGIVAIKWRVKMKKKRESFSNLLNGLAELLRVFRIVNTSQLVKEYWPTKRKMFCVIT